MRFEGHGWFRVGAASWLVRGRDGLAVEYLVDSSAYTWRKTRRVLWSLYSCPAMLPAVLYRVCGHIDIVYSQGEGRDAALCVTAQPLFLPQSLPPSGR